MGETILRILRILLPNYFMIGKAWIYPLDKNKGEWNLGYWVNNKRSNHKFTRKFEKNDSGTLLFQEMKFGKDEKVFDRNDYLRIKEKYDMYKRYIRVSNTLREEWLKTLFNVYSRREIVK